MQGQDPLLRAPERGGEFGRRAEQTPLTWMVTPALVLWDLVIEVLHSSPTGVLA